MGKAQERRDAEEKKARLKAEKDAKKKALKEARAAKKAAKATKDDPGPAPEALNAEGWSEAEQASLDEALRVAPTDDAKARWAAIAERVGSRTAKECLLRFREVRSNLLARKDWEERKRIFDGEVASVAREAYEAAYVEAAARNDDDDDTKEEDDDDQVHQDVGGGVSRADPEGQAADDLAASGIIATFAAPALKRHRNAKDISVSNLAVAFHGHTLISESELTLNWGNKYGFVGKNGSGKSTLMRVLGARAVPIPESIDIFHLTKEYPPTKDTALEAVLDVDDERAKVEREIDELNAMLGGDLGVQGGGKDSPESESGGKDSPAEEDQDEVTDRLNSLYDRLEALDAATATTRASEILTGLGFSEKKKQSPTSSFSGGWRMRVALARALFIQPDLLLLDEPTNHLDMEAVVWLEEYLSKWPKMLFMVCHSQDFLNNVCTHIVHLDHHARRLAYYRGNYDSFVETRRDANVEMLKRYQAEQADIAAMKEYVARFGHGTAKLARQGKSKEKLLTKKLTSGTKAEKPADDEKLKFKFPDPGPLPPPVLQVNSLTFGYPGCPDLYRDVDFGVDLESRVALVGPNGAGKSTLVSLIFGELVPRGGQVRPHSHLRMSKFTQHFEDVLDYGLTPLDWFMAKYPEVTREDARKWLGRYGTTGSVQQQKISQLSDGQKAKVVFCNMAKEQAHILLLDEPTNALDMDMIDSLADAINDFAGGVVLVSHDMRLISQVAKEIWIVDNGVTKYDGDIARFKMDLRSQMKLDGDYSSKKETEGASSSSKKKKRDSAAAVKKKINTTEETTTATVTTTTTTTTQEGAPDDHAAAPEEQIKRTEPPPPPPTQKKEEEVAPVGRYIPPARRRQMEAAAAAPEEWTPGDGAW